jgi:DNA-binding transcriptional MerR regulator
MKKQRDEEAKPVFRGVEDLDFRVVGEEVIFSVGGVDRVKVNAKKLIALVSGPFIQNGLQAALAGETAGFGIPGFVQAARLLAKGLRLEEVARVMALDEADLRQFYGAALQRYDLGRDTERRELTRQREEGRDYCKGLPGEPRYPDGRRPEAGNVLLDLRVIARLKCEGLADGEIAKRLDLDRDDFAVWMRANEPLLAFVRP